MSTRLDSPVSLCRGSAGFMLIEVIVALGLVAILLVPLATGVQAAVGRVERVESQTTRLSPARDPDPSAEAWTWGAMVTRVVWEPGPVMRLRVQGRVDEDLLVGLWADGWFLEEHIADPERSLVLEAPVWSGIAGCELVVRARRANEVWGPPWRTVVPDVYGEVPACAEAVEPSEESATCAGDIVVAHTRFLAAPVVAASWTMAPGQTGALGLPVFLSTGGEGFGTVAVEERTQAWLTEVGRGGDFYF